MNILVCDDDQAIVDAIEIYLSQEGYTVLKAYDGLEAIRMVKEKEIQLVILDIMMPRMDGIRATMKIREISAVPIIFLSAKSEDVDKILGLNVGADDYITKPFNPLELNARVKSVLRRYTQLGAIAEKKDTVFQIGGLRVDDDRKEVTVDGEPVSLTLKEFEMLCVFLENRNVVLTRDQLLNKVWGYAFDGESRTVDVHIRSLRQKLGEYADVIETVRGIGYKLSEPEGAR